MTFNNIPPSKVDDYLKCNSFDNNNLEQHTLNQVNNIVLSQDLPFEFPNQISQDYYQNDQMSKTYEYLDYNLFDSNNLEARNEINLTIPDRVNNTVLSQGFPFEFQNPIPQELDQNDLVNLSFDDFEQSLESYDNTSNIIEDDSNFSLGQQKQNEMNHSVLSRNPFEFQNPLDSYQNDQTYSLFNSLGSQEVNEVEASLLQGSPDPIPFNLEQVFAESFGEINSSSTEAPLPIHAGEIKKRKITTSEEIQTVSDKAVSKTIYISNLRHYHLQSLLDNSFPTLQDETRDYFKNLIWKLNIVRTVAVGSAVEIEVKHLRALLEKQMISSTGSCYELRRLLVDTLKASGETKIQSCNRKERISVKTIEELIEVLPLDSYNIETADYFKNKILPHCHENNLKCVDFSALTDEGVLKLKKLIDGSDAKHRKKHRVVVISINKLFDSRFNKS